MHWQIIWDYRYALLDALELTLLLTAVSIVGSVVFGTILACLNEVGGMDTRRVVRFYIEVISNLPTLGLLFIIYFVASVDAIPATLLMLILHQGAYVASVVISGFRTLPVEQMESAHASGLSRLQALQYVAIPQVFRSIMPAMTNQLIEVLKNSSAAMLIGVHELTFTSQEITQQTFRGFEAGTVVSVIYIALALAIALSVAGIQKLRAAK
jgi:His/Glu/Gln/Arg/opine family amino acid ABC transporter permease subunit